MLRRTLRTRISNLIPSSILKTRATRRRQQRFLPLSARFESLEARQLLSATGTAVADAPVEVDGMTLNEIQSLTYRQFNQLNSAQVVFLTGDQVGSVPNNWWFRRMATDIRAALTESQVQSLAVSRVGLSNLTEMQRNQILTEQVQSLGYREFRFLNAEQTPLLTGQQLSTIPNSWWFRRIPTPSRAALTTDQVPALRVDRVGLSRLTGDQIDAITVNQIQSLGYRDFRFLDADQTPHLTREQLATIPNSWWFRRMSSDARSAMTLDQIPSLSSKIGIGYLTETQRAALTSDQIQSVNYRDFRFLNADQTPLLTAEQIASIPNSWWFGKISSDARAAITAEQIPSLNVARVGISGLTDSQVDALTPEQIQSLNYRQFEHLSPEQIVHLTAAQVGTIPNSWWLGRIPSDSRAAMTAEQVAGLNVKKVGISKLTAEQITFLSAEQITTLGYRDFERLSADQIVHLTADQIATIPNHWWLRRIPNDVRAALTGEQVRALNVAKTQLSPLKEAQRLELSVAQIQSLGYRDFGYLSASQIVHLTAEQLQSIPNTWWFRRIPELVRQALTPAQIQALNVTKVSIGDLSGSAREHLTIEQIQSLHPNDFRYLSAEQAVHLTRAQLSSITNHRQFRNMSAESRAALSQDQLLTLPNMVHAAMNHRPASMFAPDEDHGPSSATDDSGHGTGPHVDDPDKMLEHHALFDLVPHDEADFVSIASGEWSDPDTWKDGLIPGEDAQVLIASGTTVTFDVIQYDAMDWVRVDGTLDWDTDDDTQLYLDTLVVDAHGSLLIGSADDPVEHGVAARIVIADSGEDIDTEWDPIQISRGVISHGTAQFYGEDVTPYVSLAEDPRRGDTTLTLDEVPVNWEAGNRLVLTGINGNPNRPDDEELEIVSINGNVVTIDSDSDEPGIQPLQYHHRTPAGHDLSVYVANMNRNVVIMSENPSVTQSRGHVMFMHNQNAVVDNVGFYGLGRTDKRNPANDAVLNDHDELVPGLNQRGRYAVHFHRAGTTYADNPGIVEGSVVVDSPGLGFVNHESYVHMRDNVAFNVVGSSFFTEFGNEIGSFERNLSIRNTGSGNGLESRKDIFDFGHGGHGFWMQGPGVEVVDNISTGARDSAFNFFTTSSEAKFDTANMADPSLAAGRDKVPVGMVPLRKVDGNIAFGSRSGLETWFHQTNSNAGQSYIDNFTTWNVGRGVFNPYTGRTTIRNATVIGNQDRPRGTAFGRNNVTNQMTYENVEALGWQVGIDVPVNRTTVIENGTFEAVQAIRISTAHDTLREVDIIGNPEFVTLSDSQLRGREQFDIFMNGNASMKNRDIETYFTPDIVRLGTVRFNDHQVYYHKQAADYVPFTEENAPEWLPAELIGKTNTELWTEFGLAPAGTIAPEDAVEVGRINGLVGSRSDYQERLRLVSRKYTNELSGYQLRYRRANGDLVVDNQQVDLREGWNLITRDVDGEKRTFFVYGDTTAPEFRLTMSDEQLRVNPEGLRHGFVVHGRVIDDSFGDKMFRKRYGDLRDAEILTDADGTEYINLSFTVTDLAGNSLAVTVRVVLDPDAPLVPGTAQRNLPPRRTPKTLDELIEYYFLTGDGDASKAVS